MRRCLFKAERSHSGTSMMCDCDGHLRSFSVRPSERPLHLQDRVLASGWHKAIGEGPVSHRAKWHSRPKAGNHWLGKRSINDEGVRVLKVTPLPVLPPCLHRQLQDFFNTTLGLLITHSIEIASKPNVLGKHVLGTVGLSCHFENQVTHRAEMGLPPLWISEEGIAHKRRQEIEEQVAVRAWGPGKSATCISAFPLHGKLPREDHSRSRGKSALQIVCLD